MINCEKCVVFCETCNKYSANTCLKCLNSVDNNREENPPCLCIAGYE